MFVLRTKCMDIVPKLCTCEGKLTELDSKLSKLFRQLRDPSEVYLTFPLCEIWNLLWENLIICLNCFHPDNSNQKNKVGCANKSLRCSWGFDILKIWIWFFSSSPIISSGFHKSEWCQSVQGRPSCFTACVWLSFEFRSTARRDDWNKSCCFFNISIICPFKKGK